MAAVSISPTPAHLSAMATRRVPLGSNPNAANSPLRASSASLLAYQGSKLSKARSHADMMREEAYGQPPPAKRQMVDHGVQRPMPSPTRSKPRNVVHRGAYASRTTEQAPVTKTKASVSDIESIRAWQTQTRARFPRMVFYFESVSDDQRAKLAKQVAHLGARVETFFSSEITHLVTTRQIPSDKAVQDEAQAEREQPKTIDPSLLNRTADVEQAAAPSVRRRLLFETKQSKPRSTDVLQRARELNKKIWSLEKLQKILSMVLEADPYKSALLGHEHRHGTAKPDLMRLLKAERINGPSDRDPSVVTKEYTHFKGPYIFVYDVEQKTRPIMNREYPKVLDKKDGEWPQFRVASQGRCPFVEDLEPEKESRTQKRAAKAAVEAAAPSLRPPEVPPPKPVTGKRTLTEMEDGQNRGASHRRNESFDRLKVSITPSLDFRAPNQNAFMSHAKTGRFLAGEPVASGVQPSNVTSAIRSQMISSTTGALGAKAGTSKEIHGLQRKVLVQKASTPAVSQDLSSRRMAEMSHDSNTFIRSASVSVLSRQLDAVDEDELAPRKEKVRRTVSAPIPVRQKARDPKPGYCENCQDKFDDFDDHILSRKHRKFADNDDNWAQLDALLGQLKRIPRFGEDEW
ncbi:Dfp1/Him1, central region-domain-containing protein [Podospora aff. communis PSN243]|uniref:Dfp1/Him1, central region-domain-containing protein n=1 Tax=Podospora aff. communis PSN243 TaxID=3040156 RepID=A0AAV9H0D7_9PEZI|nr:Dfp1/Him1, central region-domain-containing protein [Podospora aff. communis PSN243]